MMKQPYSCWLEVSEGVRWDRKKSPEPNLQVCGEDDIKRTVYKKKESIEGGDWKEKEKTKILKRKPKKELNLFEEERNRFIRANLSK